MARRRQWLLPGERKKLSYQCLELWLDACDVPRVALFFDAGASRDEFARNDRLLLSFKSGSAFDRTDPIDSRCDGSDAKVSLHPLQKSAMGPSKVTAIAQKLSRSRNTLMRR